MSEENARIDDNYERTLIAVTDDSNREIRRLIVDPVTNRLKTSVSGTVGLDAGDTNIGNVNILNSSDVLIDPATEPTLLSIKDTDGIKKITDALPVGDNLMGRVKISDGTEVANVNTSNQLEVSTFFADSPALDAFARQRISNPVSKFENKNIHNRNKNR